MRCNSIGHMMRIGWSRCRKKNNFFQPVASLMLLMVFLSGCPGREDSLSMGDFSYRGNTPAELLAYLQVKSGSDCPTVAVGDAPEFWIRADDVANLMQLVGSDELSANVHSVSSSFLDCRLSTVGREAAFLITGFRQGQYPPELNSGNAEYNVREIRRWWQTYRPAK